MDTPEQIVEREGKLWAVSTVLLRAGLGRLVSEMSVADAERLYEAMVWMAGERRWDLAARAAAKEQTE